MFKVFIPDVNAENPGGYELYKSVPLFASSSVKNEFPAGDSNLNRIKIRTAADENRGFMKQTFVY